MRNGLGATSGRYRKYNEFPVATPVEGGVDKVSTMGNILSYETPISCVGMGHGGESSEPSPSPVHRWALVSSPGDGAHPTHRYGRWISHCNGRDFCHTTRPTEKRWHPGFVNVCFADIPKSSTLRLRNQRCRTLDHSGRPLEACPSTWSRAFEVSSCVGACWVWQASQEQARVALQGQAAVRQGSEIARCRTSTSSRRFQPRSQVNTSGRLHVRRRTYERTAITR